MSEEIKGMILKLREAQKEYQEKIKSGYKPDTKMFEEYIKSKQR